MLGAAECRRELAERQRVERLRQLGDAIIVRVARQDQIKLRCRPFKIALFKGYQPDLDPGLARVGLGAFERFKLAQGFVELVLADVELA